MGGSEGRVGGVMGSTTIFFCPSELEAEYRGGGGGFWSGLDPVVRSLSLIIISLPYDYQPPLRTSPLSTSALSPRPFITRT